MTVAWPNCGERTQRKNNVTQHIHILGICGTFMGSLARLAKDAGYRVTGCDAGVYPPMSTQLEDAGIELIEGFSADQLRLKPDVFVIGNVVSRGNALMEAILDSGAAYASGPQWLAEHILRGRWVLGVAGTHGKTTTTSMLTWILQDGGFAPGYLIGGVAQNFGRSSSLGESDFFVIEADEYDTAFFDKRSKFVHYQPRTLILNNLEFDHADIFADLAAIQTQFHHLIRTVPGNGQLIHPAADTALVDVIERGCWTPVATSGQHGEGANWGYQLTDTARNHFDVYLDGEKVGHVAWSLSGAHNIQNGLHAIAAARHVGVVPEQACESLSRFGGVKRRMEVVGEIAGITVYDDFAHHPTAIATTLAGARARIGKAPLIAVIEPRSNTMKMGVHREALAQASAVADQVWWFEAPDLGWPLREVVQREDGQAYVYRDHAELRSALVAQLPQGAHVVVMSNGGFDAMPRKILSALETQA